MTTAVTTATGTTTATNTAATTMKSSLGMDSSDFLNLFIAQLKYQDPLAPQDATAMLSQLSQLTLVEQSYNNTTALNSLLAAQNKATSINAVSFIGGTIKANGNAVNFDGNTSPALQYNLSGASASGSVTITNSAGKTVRTIALGAQSAGDNTVAWDGCDGNGTKLAAGVYNFTVKAANVSGGALTATTYTTGVVTGVSFANSTPTLNIGAAPVALSDVISVKAG